MTLKELIDEQTADVEDIYVMIEGDETLYTLEESKKVTPLDYDRHWHVFGPHEIHYSKKTGKRLDGCWVYSHREAAGLKYGDGKIAHHKNHNKHDNSKRNIQATTRSGHCKIDPNARKHYKCKIKGCNGEHFSHGYCEKHYMQRYRNNEL